MLPEKLTEDNPEVWVKALRDDHFEMEGIPSIAIPIARAAVQGSISDTLWEGLLKAGLLQVVFEILCEDEIMGLSKEQMVNDRHPVHEKLILPYLIDILVIMEQAFLFLMESGTRRQDRFRCRTPASTPCSCASCAFIEACLLPVKNHLAAVLKALWSVADPLLFLHGGDISFHNTPEGYYPLTLENVLARSCMDLDILLWQLQKPTLSSDLQDAQYRSLHFLLAIWTYSKEDDVRTLSLVLFGRMLHNLSIPGLTSPFNILLDEIVRGGVNPADIQRALLHDLKSTSPLFMNVELFNSLLGLIPIFHCIVLDGRFAISPSEERQTLWYTLAAARAHLCSGHLQLSAIEEERLFTRLMLATCSHICTFFAQLRIRKTEIPELPESWIHAIIPMFAKFMVHSKELDSYVKESFDFVIPAVHDMSCTIAYHNNRPNSSGRRWDPPSPSVRRFTRKAWQEVHDTLHERRAQEHFTLRALRNAWIRLGKELKHGEDRPSTCRGDAREFGILERCAWEDCACSVHFSIHPFRACTGCSLVAYCSIRCQRGDWTTHKAVCTSTWRRRR